MRAGARPPRRRADGRGRRTPSRRSSWRPSSAPTASSSRPTATCRACASCATARHRDDLRRGDGRLRPLRRVVRLPEVGRAPDLCASPRGSTPATCRSAAWSSARRSPTRSTTAPYPGGLTYSGHPLACASAVASINIFKEEGIIEHARMLGTDVIGPGAGEAAGQPPVGRRGARPRRVLGDRAGPQPGDPRAARAVQRRRRGRQADERPRRGVQGTWAVAVHPLQPRARRAAVHDDRRRGARWPRRCSTKR